MNSEGTLLAMLIVILGGVALYDYYQSLQPFEAILFIATMFVMVILGLIVLWELFSKSSRDKRKRISEIKELPTGLLIKSPDSVYMGEDQLLKIPIHLPDVYRFRHVHILGATGSGKTESVILNFLRQDVSRGLGSIILDAKGDASFIWELERWVPKERLRIFDLGSEKSLTYNPLEVGSPMESAQRLFSSLSWSEEYYKSKALSALQRIFQSHFEAYGKNPRLRDLSDYLEDPESYTAVTISKTYPPKLAEREFMELSGLRDQTRSLCIGHLSETLSPKEDTQMNLLEARNGNVLYFRLQSLLSPQLVTSLGKLLINHLNYLAGTAHRGTSAPNGAKLVPIYLDEFATFACPEFADLISKARSAGLALHFSHQSIGDVSEVSAGFLNQITDNSATKIVMRINDPDSADFFARSYGTRKVHKFTHRITNMKDLDDAEIVGEGSQRDGHQFRSPPDLFKTLPTGVGSVMIAHGCETPHGASSVFRIKFPRL